MQTRENALNKWLTETLQNQDFTLTPLAGDASFRRYFRLHHPKGTYVVMDAPPEKESLTAFIDVEKRLRDQGLRTPCIRAKASSQGFLLLDDLGDRLLLNEPSHAHYETALDVLVQLQGTTATSLPYFNEAFMLQEMSLFQTWFLDAHLKITLNQRKEKQLTELFKTLARHLAEQPQCFIHRDYHSRNLMVTATEGLDELGVIDFQDAMQGPFTYDLVSLLKDCYIQLPTTTRSAWVNAFYDRLPNTYGWSRDEFELGFDGCGLQRHLKVLGVFCRLHLRDGKSNYLKDLPLTLDYTLACLERYSHFEVLLELMHHHVLPLFQDKCPQ